MGVTLREAVAADCVAVVALWQAAGLTRPWNDPVADFRLAMAGPASCVLVAEAGGALVGAIMVGFNGHRGWVYYLGVDPARRRQGLGRALMAAAEDWLAARDCPKLMLMVRHDNPQTRAFYAALGFEVQPVDTLESVLIRLRHIRCF